MLQKVIQIVLGKIKNCLLYNALIIVITFHSAHGIRVKLVSNWEHNMLCTQSLQALHRKGISLLTHLKILFLTCKCVFYRPELNAKGRRPHKIEFHKSWNDTYQSIELKNRWEKWGYLCSYHVYSHIYGL